MWSPTPEMSPPTCAGSSAPQLPEYMIPAAFVPVEQLPLGANGKVDRRALPAPGVADAPAAAIAFVHRPGAADQLRSGRDVLGGRRVGADDNFFDVGGHSLLLVQVQRRLQEALGRDLSIVDLFERPTIRAPGRIFSVNGPSRVVDRPAVGEAPVVRGDVAIIGMAGRFPGAATSTRSGATCSTGSNRLRSSPTRSSSAPASSRAGDRRPVVRQGARRARRRRHVRRGLLRLHAARGRAHRSAAAAVPRVRLGGARGRRLRSGAVSAARSASLPAVD